jgi:hypothetical protein
MVVTVIENRGFEEKDPSYEYSDFGAPQTIPTTPDMRLALSKILSSQKGLLHMLALSLCKGH